MMVVEAGVEVPGRTGVKPGTMLYKVLWKDFPPEIATWEDEVMKTPFMMSTLRHMRRG